MKAGVFMKKTFIILGVIVFLVISIFAVTHFIENNQSNKMDDFKTEINVDNWLKITKIFEYDGKLALIAENVSDTDVEYALLTVKEGETSYTFNISVMLRGAKVMLICNEDVDYNPDKFYTGWKIDNIINFEKTPVMNADKYEIQILDGSISVKNVSGEDITSDIFIYYKETNEDLLNGSITHRIRIAGLKADAQTYVKSNNIDKDNCQIIFTEYDKKV